MSMMRDFRFIFRRAVMSLATASLYKMRHEMHSPVFLPYLHGDDIARNFRRDSADTSILTLRACATIAQHFAAAMTFY